MNTLLLGGSGFLGCGLQKELSERNLIFKSLDKEDLDLFNVTCIDKLISIFKNFDNIVILASKIGIDIFESDAKNAAAYNKTIYENIFTAIKLAAKKYNKSFSINYYSTSEVFGSQEDSKHFISEKSDYKFDFSNPRHLYSYVKWQAERDFYLLKYEHPEIISSVKILRPFNIFGRNQKRGVVYEMVKSAILENVIRYRIDTTRTLTNIDFASKLAVDTIIQDKDIKINLVDSRNSLTLKSLAEIITKILKKEIKFVKLPPDMSIQYRNVSKVDLDLELSLKILKPHILELAQEII